MSDGAVEPVQKVEAVPDFISPSQNGKNEIKSKIDKFLNSSFTKELKLSSSARAKFKEMAKTKKLTVCAESQAPEVPEPLSSHRIADEHTPFKANRSPVIEEHASPVPTSDSEQMISLFEFKAALLPIKHLLGPVFNEVHTSINQLIKIYNQLPLAMESEDQALTLKLEQEELELKYHLRMLLSVPDEQLDALQTDIKYLEVFADKCKGPSTWGVKWRGFLDKILTATRLPTISKIFEPVLAQKYIEAKKNEQESYLKLQQRTSTLAAIAALNIDYKGILEPPPTVYSTRAKLKSIGYYLFKRQFSNNPNQLADKREILARMREINTELKELEAPHHSKKDLHPDKVISLKQEHADLVNQLTYLKFEPTFRLKGLTKKLTKLTTYNEKDIKPSLKAALNSSKGLKKVDFFKLINPADVK